jgi:predicted CXXCH cytochrome family protein
MVGSLKLDAAGMKESGHCQSCHDRRGSLGALSPAHRVAAGLYHEEASALSRLSPSQACLRCHDNTSGSTWQTATDRQLSFNTHASHPFGVLAIPRKDNSSNWIAQEIDPRLPIFDGKIECQTCHLLTAGAEDLLVPFPRKAELCLGCHQEAPEGRRSTEAYLASMVKD